MNLTEKIEEIKRKPEHIRLRYVWFFVLISMIAVIIIWIFSIKATIQNESGNINPASSIESFSSQMSEEKEAMQSAIEGTQKMIKNGIEENKVPESIDSY